MPVNCRMCAQKCPGLARVVNGRLVGIEGNPNSVLPGVCGRSAAAAGMVYNPNRVQTPLIRVGERGEGKFRRATWSEALDLVASKLKDYRDKGIPEAVAFLCRFHSAPGLDKEFFKIYGTPNFPGYADTCWANSRAVGAGVVYGPFKKGLPACSPSKVTVDFARAKYGVLIGRNPAGGLVCYPWAMRFAEGKRKGLKLTVVDPRKPSEAGEDNVHWIPIRPGADLAFLLGVFHELVKNKSYDANYLKKYTNAPMLVDPKTLQPIGVKEIEKTKIKHGKVKKIKVLDYLVYDEATKQVRYASEAKKPALHGTFDVTIGNKVIKGQTALDRIAKELEAYTPEWAAEQSDVPVEEIRKIARELDENRPHAFIDPTYRSERYFNSFKMIQVINMMNVFIGAFGREGGIVWNHSPKTGHYIKPPKPKAKPIIKYYEEHDPNFRFSNHKYYRRKAVETVLTGKPYPIKAMVFWGQNLLGGSAGGTEIVEALKKLDFTVCISPFFNETTLYADVILPDATFVERDEAINGKYKSPVPTLAINMKAIDPLFDAKDPYWIVLELAKRVLKPEEYDAYFKHFEQDGIEGLWKKQLAGLKKVSDHEKAEISLDRLKQFGIWNGTEPKPKPKAKTPTHKLEIFSTFLAKEYAELKAKGDPNAVVASPLPVWQPTNWMTRKAKLDRDEFIPVTGFAPVNSFTGQQTKDNRLLANIGKAISWDAVFINKAKGKALGLKDGDLVKIWNPDNKLVQYATVRLSELVHPDAMFSFYTVGPGAFRQLNNFYGHAPKYGFNPNHSAPFHFAPLTGGHAAHDYIIKIRRA
ncbi:Molybdopterin oxydoreductase, catalytic subunit A [Dissulfuribacter thermophilus]|uniref:Molybdopterin oxydoreductase, catalytic subunit A n=1 Tax=Dissulfuribacter thermophilus TaxID=1156395 RepID=A0A1B9F2N0_9BACT|nr:Molybdopterin oxydoreductase, catalytic subunit A [Dissulfuribacter thermophilus]